MPHCIKKQFVVKASQTNLQFIFVTQIKYLQKKKIYQENVYSIAFLIHVS